MAPLHGRVTDFAPGAGAASARDVDDTDWTPIAVPGDVHLALVEAGRLEHPFRDRAEEDARWMEEREWWIRFTLDPLAGGPLAADERVRLVFEGLDTFATVWLDGVELGRHANMFTPASFDVTGLVEPGGAPVVAIRFDPPSAHAGAPLPDQWAPYEHDRAWLRKAQCGWGWDWGPRLPTIGVWRDVALRRERIARIAGVACEVVDLPADHSRALVAVRVDVDAFADAAPLRARVALEDAAAVEVDAPGVAYVEVARPRLWWTHDLGEPALCDLRVELLAGAEAIDEQRRRVGLRTIALDRSPDPEEPGTTFFRFVLNGVPLFARGANWIPADQFVAAIAEARYATLLERAAAANMNMLRIWGGGIYEHDAFYDACDRLGILVWQDFMLSCAIYPETDAFAAAVEAEARHQVARLRTHPCLALWCANNENQWIHDRRFPERWQHPVGGARLYDEVLPRVCAELDPRTPYWPGSPYGGDDHNDRRHGDVHNWDVWHGNWPRRFGEPTRQSLEPEHVSFVRYEEDTGRFCSEFGTLSAPDPETLRRWLSPDALTFRSPTVLHHTKDTPKDKVDRLLVSVTGLTEDHDTFVEHTQIAQAEAMKFAVEHYRRRAPHCSGTLVWQLDDTWPGFSWAVLDYHGFAKAAYWALQRAFAPVLASFWVSPEDGAVQLWVVNHSRAVVRDRAHVRLAGFDGSTFAETAVDVRVAPDESRPVAHWAPGELPGGPDRYLAVRAAAASFAPNRRWFAMPKDQVRPAPAVRVALDEREAGALAVTLRATGGYARHVRLGLRDEAIRTDDDWLDLEAGEERTVRLRHPSRALGPDDVDVRWG